MVLAGLFRVLFLGVSSNPRPEKVEYEVDKGSVEQRQDDFPIILIQAKLPPSLPGEC